MPWRRYRPGSVLEPWRRYCHEGTMPWRHYLFPRNAMQRAMPQNRRPERDPNRTHQPLARPSPGRCRARATDNRVRRARVWSDGGANATATWVYLGSRHRKDRKERVSQRNGGEITRWGIGNPDHRASGPGPHTHAGASMRRGLDVKRRTCDMM